MEHGHKSTRRFFENHGKFDRNWTQVVALREPGLKELHDFLATQGRPMSQKELILAMEPHGWSRSTVQHRLARLVEHGAVALRPQGRLKMYAVAAAAPTAPLHRPPGLPHATMAS